MKRGNKSMSFKSQRRLYEVDRKWDFSDCIYYGGPNSRRRKKKFVKSRSHRRLRKQLEEEIKNVG